MTPLARRYARHTIAAHRLSSEYEDWLRSLLFDYTAVAAGGVSRESARAALRAYAPTLTPDGAASVFGSTLRTGAQDAALLNGITAHGLELDDTFEEASLHPAVVVFSAAIAVAEEQGSTVAELLLAAAVGYDVMCDVGVVLGAAESYARGFHPTAVAGALGAAAAAARLHRLDETRTTHAISLAANLAAGSLEFLSDGSWTKRLNAGHAAAVGVQAVRLAAAGFTGPEHALEGRDGFLTQYGAGFVPGRGAELVAGRYAWLTSIKLYPCCRYMHGNLDLLLDAKRQYPELSESTIESVTLAVISAGARLVSEPPDAKLRVDTPVDAQFNMPFGAALALTSGTATVAQFDQAPELAPSLLPLMRRISCVTSPAVELAFPERWAAEMSILLRDGTTIEASADGFRGSPAHRVSRADLLDKAAGLIGAEAADAVLRMIEEAAPDDSVADLREALGHAVQPVRDAVV